MGHRDVFVEIGDEMADRLQAILVEEGRSAPELLATGLQLVVGLGSGARSVIDWMGREATPEERVLLLRGMGRQALLAYGEMVVARAAAQVTQEEVRDLISEAELAVEERAGLSELLADEDFGEAWEAF